MDPSHDFFGEIRGANEFRPIKRPTIQAPVSTTQIVKKRKKVIGRPTSWTPSPATMRRSRSNSMCPKNKEKSTTPESVVTMRKWERLLSERINSRKKTQKL